MPRSALVASCPLFRTLFAERPGEAGIAGAFGLSRRDAALFAARGGSQPTIDTWSCLNSSAHRGWRSGVLSGSPGRIVPVGRAALSRAPPAGCSAFPVGIGTTSAYPLAWRVMVTYFVFVLVAVHSTDHDICKLLYGLLVKIFLIRQYPCRFDVYGSHGAAALVRS